MLNFYSLLSAFDKLAPLNGETLLKALNILWQGLLAIFVVIALIILVVKLTSVIIAKCETAKKAREERKAKAENGETE